MSDSSTSLIGESILCHENLKLRRRIAQLQAQLGEVREHQEALAEIAKGLGISVPRLIERVKQAVARQALAGEEK